VNPAATSVAYLGPAATFTHEALLTQADLAGAAFQPMGSITAVLDAVARGEAPLGFVPIENGIEGTVSATIDGLIHDVDLQIQREVVMDIHLHLMARPGLALGDIRYVSSYPHALAQCQKFLAESLPGVEERAANSTADAARALGEDGGDGAAIAPRLAAERYGLALVAEDVEDHPENQTRFVLVARSRVPRPSGHDKTSIVCFQRADHPGSLHGILGQFAARNINLTKLESRPTKQGLGDYCFFIDCEGHVADEVVADALRNLSAKHGAVKFLGSYPVGGPVEAGVERRKVVGKAWKKASAWVEGLREQIREGDDA
jgi:prephenate dehydratase